MRKITLNNLVKVVYRLAVHESFSIRDYDPETDSGCWYAFQHLPTDLDTNIIIFGIYGGDECMEIIDFGVGSRRLSPSNLKEWVASLLDDRCIEEIWTDEEDWSIDQAEQMKMEESKC